MREQKEKNGGGGAGGNKNNGKAAEELTKGQIQIPNQDSGRDQMQHQVTSENFSKPFIHLLLLTAE